jgi:hypothetical protein
MSAAVITIAAATQCQCNTLLSIVSAQQTLSMLHMHMMRMT